MTSNSDVSTRRRVKLYMLNEERQWDDKGTGHVSATFVEANSMALVVISETDGSHLLESKIQHDTAYQKQQETLIVWSEGDNMDLALSFQEKIGCDDIWEKICNVQGKDPSVDITQDLIDDTDDGDDMDLESGNGASGTGNNSSAAPGQGFEFPTCDLQHLLEISEMFSQVVNYPIQRERLATALERSQYLKGLVDLFHKAEALEDEKALHHLYEIMRAIVQFNRRNLYELIFSDELMMATVGMLEYNPVRRARHREWLQKRATLHEVIPLPSALKAKITQTYRVQYVQDSCMPPPSLFDDNAGSSLTSFVYLNKIDIITKLQEDPTFVSHLFQGLSSAETASTTRRDLLLLLKEFCAIVNSLQPSQKDAFFQFLCAKRALKALFFSFRVADESLKPVCVDILQLFVENQASAVREFLLAEPAADHLTALVEHLVGDLDPELSNGFIVTNILKVLIDPENMVNSSQKNEKQEFLNFFYKAGVAPLARPLLELTADGQLKYDDYHTAMVMHSVLELLAFCVEFHSYNMKNYAFHNNVLLRVVTLFRSQHKFVVLAALRVVRKFVASKEEFNYRYMIKNNILQHVIGLLDANRQYNMLNSAILELFEFLRTENISCLIAHVIEQFWESSLQHHNYVSTFQLLKNRYDQSIERSMKSVTPGSTAGNQANPTSSSSINMLSLMNTASSRLRKDARALDEDEEQWYDQDDEEDEDALTASYHQHAASSGPFVERYSKAAPNGASGMTLVTANTGASKTDSGTPFKLTNRYGRDQQHIPINIRSTSLTLGSTVSSTSGRVENGTIDYSSDIDYTNSDKLSASTDPIHPSKDTDKLVASSGVNSSEAAQKVTVTSPCLLTGLVDYSSDDEEDNEITSNTDSTGSTNKDNSDWSSVSSPKRVKID